MEKVKSTLTYRQRQALATRALIVDAACELFLAQGYMATTIEAISAGAGVAVSTVYAVFRNKRGILQAIRERWHQESGQRDIYREAMEQQDSKRRLELAAYATRRQWETGGAMMAIYQAAAAADPDAAAELSSALQRRHAFLTHFIDDMSEQLRPDLSPPRAVALFSTLTQPTIYQELVGEAGWSPEEYEVWLAETLQQQLLSSR
ncbi:MAG TPA: helix-turn-helix domain-containing protein [Ktedonobacteraceae bacterium]